MAMHTDLPIHKVAFDLLSLATDVTRNIPRDFKAGLGAKVRDECIEVMDPNSDCLDLHPKLRSLLNNLAPTP